MMALDSPDAFLASPVGHCIVRAGYSMWCLSPGLAGVMHWGPLNGSFIEDLVELGGHLVAERLVAPRVLCDFRELESIDVEDVAEFIEEARTKTRDLRTCISGLTVVLPGGLSGILVAGATALLTSVPRLVCTPHISQALAPLGHDVAADYVAIEEIAIEARGASFIVARVRNHIARDLAEVTVESCAVAIHISERTLQRRLHAAGTSFGEQLRRTRVDAARQLLTFGDLKIDAIACRVGFGTASRMSAIFRAELGVTPSQLRGSPSRSPVKREGDVSGNPN